LLQPDDTVQIGIEKINGLLESFLGISDTELGEILLFYQYVCNCQTCITLVSLHRLYLIT